MIHVEIGTLAKFDFGNDIIEEDIIVFTDPNTLDVSTIKIKNYETRSYEIGDGIKITNVYFGLSDENLRDIKNLLKKKGF